MGVAASANSGTVLAMFFAPRIAEVVGWRGVFGVMLGPVLLTTLLFALLVRGDGKSDRNGPQVDWWKRLRESFLHPSMYWLCFLYGVTFGGFVGICSFLPIFLHDQYGIDRVTAGSLTALGGLLGSAIRPFGGYVADHIGGTQVLWIVFALIACCLGGIGWMPPMAWGMTFLLVALTTMGFGNGVVFQVVSDRFPKQIGIASGVIGAAGGFGGFLLPVFLGVLKDLSGTYAVGFWVFAAGAVGAAISSVIVKSREKSLTIS